MLIDLAKGNGTVTDPTIRQDLMRLHTEGEIARMGNLRLKAAKKAGKDIPGMANISKLAMSNMLRLQRDLSLRIVGASGMLHAYRDEDRAALDAATGNPFLGHGHEHGAVGPGPAHLRRHRPDPAQHHR